MREIAVGVVQLDRLEADAHRALRRIDEGVANAGDVLVGGDPRHMPALAERQRRRPDGLPRILAGLQRPAALPGPLRGRLAPGMRNLDAPFGGAGAAAMLDDALQRGF